MNSVVFILLIGLVISQLIIFYLILLLFKKIGKFNDLEVRQNQLMQEMDEAITVYLMETREENDRLIAQLNALKRENPVHSKEVEEVTSLNRGSVNQAPSMEYHQQSIAIQEEQTKEKKLLVPKNMATLAYKSQLKQAQPEKETTVQTLDHHPQLQLSLEQQIVALYKEGSTIEEIAKKMKKGKTEIELLVKFHK